MPLTYFLAELMGTFCIIMGLFVLFRRNVFVEVVHGIEHTPPLIAAVGFISIILGLLVVLVHNYWMYGLLPLVVTLIGWVMLLRGVAAVFVPQKHVLRFLQWARLEKLSWLYGTIVLLIGLYLFLASHAALMYA
jgi:hypothetical protein